MKDIFQLTIYGALTVGAIFTLIAMSKMDNLPSGAVVGVAMLLVVVLPVIIAVRVGKKEQERKFK